MCRRRAIGGGSLWGVVLFFLLSVCLPARGEYEYNWESLKKIPVPGWFDDGKFGILIHWGVYSVIGFKNNGGYAEWVPNDIYKNPSFYYPYMTSRFGGCPPQFGYKDIAGLFKAENWDPNDWAELFKSAGARYVILTGEHHDGFAMWDSQLTEWCATKVGPKRDLVGDLCEAVRAKGMKFAPSYHRERHPGYFAKVLYAVNSEPQDDIAEEIRRVPGAEELYGPFDYNDVFIAGYVARWKEMQDKYQPDFMWIDDVPIFYKAAAGDEQVVKFQDACMRMIADYMNAAAGWGKEVYLNNKGKTANWPEGVGCQEGDNLIVGEIGPKWQNPATMGTSYGYMASEEINDSYKSPTELVHLLCDVVSKNGNLLLNIGPKADGTIPAGMRSRLLEIGGWLGVNGEAIYGTRPWIKYKQDSPAMRFTAKGEVVYAIALSKPAGTLVVDMGSVNEAVKVISVGMLGSEEAFQWSVGGNKLSITVPQTVGGKYAWVFKITKKSEEKTGTFFKSGAVEIKIRSN